MSKFSASLAMFACIYFLTGVARADSPIVAGRYTGQGSWYNDGKMGDYYSVSLSVTPDNLFSRYTDKFGINIREFNYSGPQENLILIRQKATVGSGFCFGSFCSFKWSENSAQLEEIWTFSGDSIKRNGRRLDNGRWVVWQDSLSREP